MAVPFISLPRILPFSAGHLGKCMARKSQRLWTWRRKTGYHLSGLMIRAEHGSRREFLPWTDMAMFFTAILFIPASFPKFRSSWDQVQAGRFIRRQLQILLSW